LESWQHHMSYHTYTRNWYMKFGRFYLTKSLPEPMLMDLTSNSPTARFVKSFLVFSHTVFSRLS
jgi:hypothetical protein